MPIKITDDDYDRALARGREALEQPHVISARYVANADEIELRYNSGWVFHFRPHDTDVFSHVPKEALAHLYVTPGGDGLILEADDIDVAVSIPGLVAKLIPLDVARSAVASARGRVRSAAKSEAARLNGLKGGRPPKTRTG